MGKPYTYHSDCRDGIKPDFLDCVYPADVVNLHWVAHFLDLPSCIPWLAERAPLVWTLHDMNPFKGIWHYEPAPDEITRPLDRWDHAVRDLKRAAFDAIPADRLKIVAPSNWMAREARNSDLMGKFEVQVIPYGLNTRAFSPVPKSVAKRALGISPEQIVIGFLEDGMGDPRKGFHKLREALELLKGVRPVLVTGGGGESQADGTEHLHLGRMDSPYFLRLFYSSLDVFVCPSLQDNLPNTVLESLACGTPVISFETGGLPDMVRPGSTGWLVPPFDVRKLAETITDAVADRQTLEMLSVTCREVAVKEYPLEVQANRYKELYEALVSGN
jgi:glycosyltransferase involved in cell wall biosynthesis